MIYAVLIYNDDTANYLIVSYLEGQSPLNFRSAAWSIHLDGLTKEEVVAWEDGNGSMEVQ